MDYASSWNDSHAQLQRRQLLPTIDRINGETHARRVQDRRQRVLRLLHECGKHLPGPSREVRRDGDRGARVRVVRPCFRAPHVGVDDFAAVLKANQLCDELASIRSPRGNLIGCGDPRGYEKGIAHAVADLDGVPITWGDQDAILGLIHQDLATARGNRATRWGDGSPPPRGAMARNAQRWSWR